MNKINGQELDLAEWVQRNETLLSIALTSYAEYMEEAATEARAAYEAGQADPAVKAAQDGSLVTNNGLRISAEMFTDSAERARFAASEMDDLLDAEEDE